ncbi:hypothetical protein GCM10007161_13530 [Ignatzschineria indica]|uniref:Phage tail tape measure protein n=1 Tax=Ignatzschineria indica TaxID=472583 RepID=A0A2U2AJR9_9GAMM|nr:hypothetical protein [Ignatzschineria indica]PWD83051.1 hypothetical protein DC082_06395 [Ignatzschineria indica]GGZ83320.1 hypothetical protein GCM10007161_13530 [Ignatzschineria indica]
MSNSLGTLTLDLVAQMGGWVNGFTQAERATKAETRKMQRSIREVEKSVKSMGNTLRNIAGLIGLTLTVSAFDNWIRGSVQAAASAGVFAEKIGLTTEELTTFRYIAVQTGSDIQSLDSSMLRLNSRLGAAVNGKGSAADTLKRLGLNAKELLNLPLEERILAISKAMEGLSRGEQLRSLQNIAGDSARGLINMFQLSKDEIAELTNRAERLGYVYSTEMAKSADVVLGKIGEMKGAFGNLSLQILSEFLPDIESYLNSISLEDIEEHLETARVVVDNLGIAIKALAITFGVTLTSKIAANTIAFGLNSAAQIINATAAKRVGGASKTAAIAIGTKTVAVNGLRIALGALGGPLGIAILTSLSFLALKSSQDKTKISSDELAMSLDDLEQVISKLTMRQANAKKLDFDIHLDNLKEKLQGEKEEYQKLAANLEDARDKLENPERRKHLSNSQVDRVSDAIARMTIEEIRLGGEIDTTNQKIDETSEKIQMVIGHMKRLGTTSVSDLSGVNDQFDDLIAKIEDQTARMGLKTNSAVFEYELRKTTKYDYLKGDDGEETAELKAVRAAFAEQDAKERSLRISTKSIDIAAEYRKVMEGTLSDEERRGQELAKNLDILKRYGASEEDILAVRRSAYESMSTDMPDMGSGGDTLTAQLARIGENMAQLDAWREEQLQKLELAYGNEESALAESLQRREELEEQYRERRSQFEGEMNQELLNLGVNLTSDSLSALREAGIESGAIYKAMFLTNKAASFANAIVSANEAGAKALAAYPDPIMGMSVGAMVKGIGLANAGVIAATGLKGMAHSGLDKVPETGTWLLEKGERVVTANTSAKLDATLESLRGGLATKVSTPITVNIVNNSPAEVETRQRSDENGMPILDVIINGVTNALQKDMSSGGPFSRAMESNWGLRKQVR